MDPAAFLDPGRPCASHLLRRALPRPPASASPGAALDPTDHRHCRQPLPVPALRAQDCAGWPHTSHLHTGLFIHLCLSAFQIAPPTAVSPRTSNPLQSMILRISVASMRIGELVYYPDLPRQFLLGAQSLNNGTELCSGLPSPQAVPGNPALATPAPPPVLVPCPRRARCPSPAPGPPSWVAFLPPWFSLQPFCVSGFSIKDHLPHPSG